MYISIYGNIGVGKSSLLSKLSDHKYKIYYEPVDTWKFLPLFYEDKKKYCFPLQIEIIQSFNEMVLSNSIVERSPMEACNIFAKCNYYDNNLSKLEFSLIQRMTNQSKDPDVIVYLQATPKISYERIRERNRDCEKNISYDYVYQLHSFYESSIFDLIQKGKKVITLDASKSKDEIFSELLCKCPEIAECKY